MGSGYMVIPSGLGKVHKQIGTVIFLQGENLGQTFFVGQLLLPGFWFVCHFNCSMTAVPSLPYAAAEDSASGKIE